MKTKSQLLREEALRMEDSLKDMLFILAQAKEELKERNE